MTHFIEGKRIYLRAVELSDVTDAYVRWMNDPNINRYMETWHFPHTRANIEQYVKDHTDNRNEPFFAIFKKEFMGSHIGNIKLGPINWIHRYADISLFMGEKDLWGQGYATEAINLVTEYAFKKLNLHKVKSGIYYDNKGSLRAFQKAGFKIEATLPKHVWFNGDYQDIWLVGRINE